MVSGKPLMRELLHLEKLMKTWMLLVLFGLSCSAMAENPPLDCQNAMSTLEMNRCASMALDSAEAELARYLAASLAHNADDLELVNAINAAQTDWQAYRLSHCNSVYMQWRDGSIRGVMAFSCKTQLTKQRSHDIWKNFLSYMDGTPAILPEPDTSL